jgi:hypothetical protein
MSTNLVIFLISLLLFCRNRLDQSVIKSEEQPSSEKTKKPNFVMIFTYSPILFVLLGGCFRSGQAWLTPSAFVQTSQKTSILTLKSTVPDVLLSTLLKTYMPPEVLPPKRNRNANSTHRLSRLDVQRAMTDVKRFVESRLESDLDLVKVSSPLIQSCYFSH